MQDQMPPQDNSQMPDHGPDREGAMAKADLYKLANYSLKLFKQIQDEDQLEGWVQAKITKAADYIASVYHYMEYEMKFSEYGHHLDNSDTLSEGQRRALKGKLMEAKEKMKELKKKQATKAKGKKEKEVDENLTVVPNPSGAKDAEEAKKLGAMMPKPAGSEKDPIKEETSSTGGTITREKGKVRHSHNPDRFTDEPHGEVASKVKAQSASDKAGEKAADKAEEKEGKNWEKRFGKGSVTRVKDGKKVDEGSKPDFLDMDKDGDKKEPMKKAVADKKAGPKKGVNPFAKKTNEALKGGQKALDADDDGDIEADDLADLRAKKEKKVNEAEKTMSRAAIGKTMPVKEAAKWRDAKHKDKLYTQEPRDDHYDYHDTDYYNGPKPDDYPGEKNLIGGGEFDHNDPLRKGYGRYGTGSLNTHGKRKGMPSRDQIRSLKGSIKDAHGTHTEPSLPEAKQTMSRAAKGHEKYGKEGMAALAKAGKEGKNLEPVRAKYDKYDESAKPSAGLTKAQKSATVKDAKAGKDIGKTGKSFDKVAKAAGGGEKGTKIAAAAMWKNKAKSVKETQSPFPSRNAGTPAAADAAADAAAKAAEPAKPVQSVMPSRNVVKESAELTRMKQFLTRLNG